MSAFQEQLKKDLQVFLNGDEFAENHTITSKLGAVNCPCVLQSPTAKEQFLSGEKYDRYDGISGELYILHIAKENLPEVPSEGVYLTIDGHKMEVSSCVDDMGMLSITLQANMRGVIAWPSLLK